MFQITKGKLLGGGAAALIVAYLCNRCASVYFASSLTGAEGLLAALNGLGSELVKKPLWIDTSEKCLLAAAAGIGVALIGWLYLLTCSRNTRAGAEHGSARWGSKADLNGFFDVKNKDNNIILSTTEQLRMNGKPPGGFAYDRNKNVLIIGGSGCGKSYGIIEPNLLQMHSSYVITDPKGTILPEVGSAFSQNGYKIKVLNTINFKKSLHYNPLCYIKDEKDILKVVDVLMKNTSGDGEQKGEDFWVKSERLLYTALIAYLFYEAPAVDRHLPMLSDMIDLCGASEDDESFQSPMDIMFENLEQSKGSSHFAVKQYKKFKQAAGKTLKSILISCAARLAPFDIEEVRQLMVDDELELNQLGDRKTALFVIMPDTDTTFSFIIAMCFYQMFNLLCTHADDDCGGKLPVPVRCLFDEFANCGRIPMFEILISTIRSRLISATIVLQSMTQLTNVYKDNAETIIDCCDSYVFLGGKSTKTTEQLSKMLGKETIDTRNFNTTKGQQGSFTENNQTLGRDLLDPAEIGQIRRTECIVSITGLPPFRSQKYNLTQHPRYKQTGLADPALLYDVQHAIAQVRDGALGAAEPVNTYITETVDVSELLELAALEMQKN